MVESPSSSVVKEGNGKVVIFKYLEFYAGIGGWTLALEEACQRLMEMEDGLVMETKCLASFDHSDACIPVWDYNFQQVQQQQQPTNNEAAATVSSKNKKTNKNNKNKNKKKRKIDIERLTKEQLEEWKADIWVMSPPCQPHTRQHSNQTLDLQDPRSASFLHLCHILETMEQLPNILLLENVVRFEESDSCHRWRSTLLSRGYTLSHFHLTPTQVGLPNQRPRYYSCAILPHTHTHNNHLHHHIPPTSNLHHHYHQLVTSLSLESTVTTTTDTNNTATLSECPTINTSIETLGVKEEGQVDVETLDPISTFLDDPISISMSMSTSTSMEGLNIPEKLLNKNTAWCFDIVTPSDRRSSCFTHGYGKYVKGTGSILYTGPESSLIRADQQRGSLSEPPFDQSHQKTTTSIVERLQLVAPDQRQFDPQWAHGLDIHHHLRYFSGTEMARLMGFPNHFSFPPDCPTKHQWKLVGNSLNIRVSSKIAQVGLLLHLFSSPATQNEIKNS